MWVTARVAAKKKTINARLRSGLCVAWLLSLVGCSAGLETEPLVEFSTELGVDGTRPSAVSRQLRSGTYLVEVLSVEPRSAVALIRVARFPTFDAGGRPLLTFFEADRERAHVATTSTPFPIAADPMGDSRSWGAGRQWADRLHLPIHRRYPPLRDAQLLIVESRRVGETRTALSATDVPVQMSKQQ